MKVPVACTLRTEDARSQIAEWLEVLRRDVARTTRVSPNRLELVLAPDVDLRTVIGLAQREAQCCQFFNFKVEIGATELTLVVEVPDDAVEVLDALGASAT